MVLLSSILLGWGMESRSILATALAGATLGFVITDCLKLYRLTGVIANIVSIAVLLVAMGNFFGVDGTGKLKAVATLLTYLLTVLMFQEKTPRLIWQLMALSLLQVVLGAIFSLDFEAGLLFFCYFLVVGAVIFQQSLYIQYSEIEQQNLASARAAGRFLATDPATESALGNLPEQDLLVFHDTDSQHAFDWILLVRQLTIWGFLALAFSMTLFQISPRPSRPWYGPATVATTTTAGVSKSVDLDERGKISLSKKLMMRVQFLSADGKELQPNGVPYFRGLALSNLVIRDGKTDFEAPFDRIDQDHYQTPRPSPKTGQEITQSFSVEESADPLIYGVFPFFGIPSSSQQAGTSQSINFCHEISALTRCPLRSSMQVRPFKYNASTLLDKANRFSQSWPYVSNTLKYRELPMSFDKPQHAWLTQIDPKRYPTLVHLSDDIAAQVKLRGGGRRDFLLAIENYFLTPGRFQYTLDYSTVARKEELDPVEDFVRNHRCGHCESFAAATTLMLRRQGIPARLVVGYCGGEFNQLTKTYLVKASHAHAWVEAYLRPEDCSASMLSSGQAGPGGAWMIVESTPAMSDAVSGNAEGEAIDLARNVWEDYVIGHDSSTESSATISPVYGWVRHLNIEWWSKKFQVVESSLKRPAVKYGIPIGLAFFALLFFFRSYLKQNNGDKKKDAGLFRRLVAKAVSFVSPELAKWVIGKRHDNPVAFYQSLEHILGSYDLHRDPKQSHREFASEVSEMYLEHPKFEFIHVTVKGLTQKFNQVRFGKTQIDNESALQIQHDLAKLKSVLAISHSQAS
jgi:hypothetical protein